jgi:hypothetical protein
MGVFDLPFNQSKQNLMVDAGKILGDVEFKKPLVGTRVTLCGFYRQMQALFLTGGIGITNKVFSKCASITLTSA